jgi:hypothetical protein
VLPVGRWEGLVNKNLRTIARDDSSHWSSGSVILIEEALEVLGKFHVKEKSWLLMKNLETNVHR